MVLRSGTALTSRHYNRCRAPRCRAAMRLCVCAKLPRPCSPHRIASAPQVLTKTNIHLWRDKIVNGPGQVQA